MLPGRRIDWFAKRLAPTTSATACCRLRQPISSRTVGEAARHVSAEWREAHPEFPWPNIIGMRHRIVHDYISVDIDILWETASRNLPELIGLLQPHVQEPP